MLVADVALQPHAPGESAGAVAPPPHADQQHLRDPGGNEGKCAEQRFHVLPRLLTPHMEQQRLVRGHAERCASVRPVRGPERIARPPRSDECVPSRVGEARQEILAGELRWENNGGGALQCGDVALPNLGGDPGVVARIAERDKVVHGDDGRSHGRRCTVLSFAVPSLHAVAAACRGTFWNKRWTEWRAGYRVRSSGYRPPT